MNIENILKEGLDILQKNKIPSGMHSEMPDTVLRLSGNGNWGALQKPFMSSALMNIAFGIFTARKTNAMSVQHF